MTKTYRVEITSSAEQDIRSIRAYIARDKPAAAVKWVQVIQKQARSLSRYPDRHGTIPEADDLGVEYREIIHGVYRTLYRIDGERVVVIRVIHSAQLLDRGLLENLH
ncbi:MAG: type II toxin-antitoxin system RelE/ParE family toxin [Planctomycetaceae bacterium]|nr:type II toxin-antitoxin system RelE/ParE family toxin [Planctomycetaceae bacterium]